ncbi:unnamed protein product [Gongylonema pulchrum]|uniref:Glycoprotein n=1 Tax=Gongylonema pulchrum TaxID=637853 RepID=A0A183CY33_9BILA|nr:unnamed protein product [Gongylonema pulchrum]
MTIKTLVLLFLNYCRFSENILTVSPDEVKFGRHREVADIVENEWQQANHLNWIRNGVLDWSKDWSVPPVTGYLRILLGGSVAVPHSFAGLLSMVQLYNGSVSNVRISEMAHQCRSWLQSLVSSDEIPVVEWDQFTGVERWNRVFPGICTVSECLLNNQHCSAEIDKLPPQVVSCPTDIYLLSTERLTPVTWSPSNVTEMFVDNGTVEMTSNFNSGDVFTW